MTTCRRRSMSSKIATAQRRKLMYARYHHRRAWLLATMVVLMIVSGCGSERAGPFRRLAPDPASQPDASTDADSAGHPDVLDADADAGPSGAPDASPPTDADTDAIPVDTRPYTVLSTRLLTADGPNAGRDVYDIIRAFGGARPIESPDLYPENHPEVPHITEATDDVVGNHFVFVIHRDSDIDRDRTEITDRQRNEIKTYDGSENALKGFEGETMVLQWLFQINAEMEVSRRFTHFFQLKAVGGNDSQPILTVSGAERSSEDGIEVRHSPLQSTTILDRRDWGLVTGQWLKAYCRATFSNDGDLRFIITRLRDGEVIFDIDRTGLDLWRGESDDHFVRPKWGIYRSILEPDNLRPDEEVVRFARFSVDKVELE